MLIYCKTEVGDFHLLKRSKSSYGRPGTAVYSSVGQQIDTFSVDMGANQVSLNNTCKGIYFLKFVSDNGDLSTKTLVVD